ncbi:hypothetical protein MRX96_031560 [Rhipicephalus microplus]
MDGEKKKNCLGQSERGSCTGAFIEICPVVQSCRSHTGTSPSSRTQRREHSPVVNPATQSIQCDGCQRAATAVIRGDVRAAGGNPESERIKSRVHRRQPVPAGGSCWSRGQRGFVARSYDWLRRAGSNVAFSHHLLTCNGREQPRASTPLTPSSRRRQPAAVGRAVHKIYTTIPCFMGDRVKLGFQTHAEPSWCSTQLVVHTPARTRSRYKHRLAVKGGVTPVA